jgi:16S rRNA (cytosine1402-N4)-methyltransferase
MQSSEIQPTLRLIAPGGIEPSEAETKANPRARSARLRVAERTDAPLEDAA